MTEQEKDRGEERVETLIDEGVLRVRDDGVVTTTTEFEKTRSVYYDTYSEVSDDEFENSVADVFGISREEARERIDEMGVTRDGFITYMSVNSEVERNLPQTEVAAMAEVVGEVSPVSAVPEYVEEIDDETYDEFLNDHPDSVVIVWKFDCAPCDRMKDEFGHILEDAPDGVTFAGVNGEEVTEFRREYEVEVAPSVLFFSDGDLVEKEEGYTSPDEIEERIDSLFE